MKRALNIEEQINKLKDRGMSFENEEKAKEILLDIGYYRLGFYSFPFERTFPELNNRDHKLIEGTSFGSIVELYYFDCDLRKLLIYYLNRIEINIRTQITYIVSNKYKQHTTWFVNPQIVESEFIKSFDKTVYNDLKKNPVIQHHHSKYINDRYAPAWKTLEFMTLGNICTLYLALKDINLKREIAKHYNCSLGAFINYIETIRVLRNKCAHGNCLYNINIPKGVKSKPANITETNRHNIAGAIGAVRYMLKQISVNRLQELDVQIKNLLDIKRSEKTAQIIKECTGICE